MLKALLFVIGGFLFFFGAVFLMGILVNIMVRGYHVLVEEPEPTQMKNNEKKKKYEWVVISNFKAYLSCKKGDKVFLKGRVIQINEETRVNKKFFVGTFEEVEKMSGYPVNFFIPYYKFRINDKNSFECGNIVVCRGLIHENDDFEIAHILKVDKAS